MSIPLFLPQPTYVKLPLTNAGELITLKELCEKLKTPCRASGLWVDRLVRIILIENNLKTENDLNTNNLNKKTTLPLIEKESGDWGEVRITLLSKQFKSQTKIYQMALGIMAYSVFDLVARESIRGLPWAKVSAPKGKPRARSPLSSKERQRRFRAK